MKKKIAIIGAGYFQLPAILKAKEMGLETHCFAWENEAISKQFSDYFYPISTINKEKILETCKKIRIDGVISISSDIAVPTINYVANSLGLIGNDPSDSLTCTNKFLMREEFKQGQVNFPLYCMLGQKDSYNLADFLKYPLIVKPVDRSGSRGIQKVNSKKELKSAIKRAQEESFINKCIVEEYIEGDEVSVESISWKGNHYILAITDKETTGAPYFVELAHHQPSLLNEQIKKNIIRETNKALDILNIKFGASHSEFIITKEGKVYAVEVGARMGGDFIGSDLVYLSTGYDFLKGVIEVSLGTFNKPVNKTNRYSGIYFLSKEREYLKSVIINRNLPQIVKAQITNGSIQKIQCSSDRSGYLIYQADNKLVFNFF